jgi:pilus assembly protein Flp/PilA
MLKDDEAQGLVEYALIIALVSIIAIAALKFLGGKASNTLNNAANSLSNPEPTRGCRKAGNPAFLSENRR